MTNDAQNTPTPAAEAQPDPWRKYRIVAGLLTVIVGYRAASTLILVANIDRAYGFLAGALFGGSPSLGVTIPVSAILLFIAFLIGGLKYCGKKGRGRLMVWLAALISVPFSLYSMKLIASTPFGAAEPNLLSVLIASMISIYLIWVLIKTAPVKESLRAKALRIATPMNLVAMVVVVGVVSVMTYGDRFETQQEELETKNWKPSESLAGLKIGMSDGELRGRKGKPYVCREDRCHWHFTSSKRPDLVVKNTDNFVAEITVVRLRTNLDGLNCKCRPGKVCDPRSCSSGSPRTSTRDSIPFDTVDQMHEILGEEDILATSGPNRKYTYQDWEVSYLFSNDFLVQVSIGESWGHIRRGEYFVKGRPICPGEACPWDDEGNLKAENEEGSYRDFLVPNPALEKRLAERKATKENIQAAEQAAEEECQAAEITLLGKWAFENRPDYYAEYDKQGIMYYSDGSDWRSEGRWYFYCENSPSESMSVTVEESIQTCTKCAKTQISHTVSILDSSAIITTTTHSNARVKRTRVMESEKVIE